MVEIYRYILGARKLHEEYCPTNPPTIGLDYTPPKTPQRYRDPCTDLLAKERKNSKIVYYVRWAD